MEEYKFGWIDYLIVTATLLFSILIGIYYAFIAKQSKEDLLVGGRKMGILPIAASMLATYMSAIAIIGYPAEVYAFGTQIFMNTIILLIFMPLSVYFFMTVFYKMKLTSIYEYLENRFESTFVRHFASFIFILQMSIFMGVCLYAPAIALKSFVGLEVWQSVVGLGLCATVYTSIGGLKAVVWTDVFQLTIMIGGLLAIFIQGFVASGGVSEAFRKANEHGRLELFNFTVDPFMRHNALNFILGQGFAVFCLFGTHQPQVQRYCALPSLKSAIKAVFFAMPLNLIVVGSCLLAGIVIFSTYVGCDPLLTGKIQKIDQIVPYFVQTQLGFIPGMMGLFTACVFSATLSTLSSGLNSLAAVVWEDFLSKIKYLNKKSPKTKANLIRLISAFFGLVSIILAFGAEQTGSNILAATITATGALSGPLGAIFVMGILMPFINRNGAIAGMSAGFIAMCWLTIGAFTLTNKSHIKPLRFNADDCIVPKTLDIGNSTSAPTSVMNMHKPHEWPEKMYTISYILYPFVGGVITFLVAIIVSVLTCGCKTAKDIEDQYLHHLLRKKVTMKAKKEANRNYLDRITSIDKSAYGYTSVSTSRNTTPLNSPSSPSINGDSPTSPSEKPLLYNYKQKDTQLVNS